MPEEIEITREVNMKKEFVYTTKSGANLAFSLLPGNEKQIKEFLGLLKLAIVDVEEALKQ